MTEKLKIVVSYIIYPLSMAGYFVNSFRRRVDVDLFTVGPYTEDFIPWAGGMKLPRQYVHPPNLPLSPAWASYQPSSTVIENQLPKEFKNPDLWLQIDAGWHFTNRPIAKIVGLIQTDPHVLNYDQPKAYSDFSFCMQTPYMKPGDILLPYGYDPFVHYPMDIPKEYDACLIGLHYEKRDKLVERIRSRNHSVHYSIGEIYDENRLAYCKSKTALSWSSLDDTPARVFEAMGMGIPLLCNRTPDLMRLFKEGTHFLGFNDLDEAAVQFELLMGDMELRKKLSLRSQLEVQCHHTWDLRISQILEVTGLVEKSNPDGCEELCPDEGEEAVCKGRE